MHHLILTATAVAMFAFAGAAKAGLQQDVSDLMKKTCADLVNASVAGDCMHDWIKFMHAAMAAEARSTIAQGYADLGNQVEKSVALEEAKRSLGILETELPGRITYYKSLPQKPPKKE